jgi:hypothetical protein
MITDINSDNGARPISVAEYLELWSRDKLAWNWSALPKEYRPILTKDRGNKFCHVFVDGSKGYIYKGQSLYHATMP